MALFNNKKMTNIDDVKKVLAEFRMKNIEDTEAINKIISENTAIIVEAKNEQDIATDEQDMERFNAADSKIRYATSVIEKQKQKLLEVKNRQIPEEQAKELITIIAKMNEYEKGKLDSEMREKMRDLALTYEKHEKAIIENNQLATELKNLSNGNVSFNNSSTSPYSEYIGYFKRNSNVWNIMSGK